MFQLHVSAIVELAIVRLNINYLRTTAIQIGAIYWVVHNFVKLTQDRGLEPLPKLYTCL
jgi:hypothetical protein